MTERQDCARLALYAPQRSVEVGGSKPRGLGKSDSTWYTTERLIGGI
jgi:hypothetical protein